MAYELTFVQGSPGRSYTDKASPAFSAGSHTFSGSITFKFADDDALLHQVGSSDPTPAKLLEETTITVGGRATTFAAGTEIALSAPTRISVPINGTNTQVWVQGLLIKDGTAWTPIVPASGTGYPGLYIVTDASGQPLILSGAYTVSNISPAQPARHVAYNGQPDPIPDPDPDPGDVECFTPGALIDTPEGPRRVEDLHPGDLVLTRDHGPQPIIWVGRRQITADQTAAAPWLRPIRIRAGALAPGCPARDLVVSPQHRLLLRSRILARVAGAAEVLTPACQLLGWPGVEALRARAGVTYLHLMCARHEVIRADGAWTETLYPGPELRRGGSPMAREIALLFPALMAPGAPVPEPARLLLRGKPLRELRRRAEKNHRALVEDLI